MAELLQQEKLQPALLDRLTDDSPQSRRLAAATGDSDAVTGTPVAASNQSDRLIITARKLRDCVRRDLSWLMNTGNLETVVDLSEYPLVARSVLNYGAADLTGHTVSNLNFRELEHKFKQTILDFEPRIIAKSLTVKVSGSNEMSGNAVHFEIECDIWGQPAPEHLHLNSELDLESGTFRIVESGST